MFNDSVLGASGRQSRRSGEAEVHLTRVSTSCRKLLLKLVLIWVRILFGPTSIGAVSVQICGFNVVGRID